MSDPEARLEAELGKLGAEHAPPVGWEARVLAEAVVPRRRRWWLVALPAFAGAATIALVILWPRAPKPPPLALSLSLEHGGPIVRGTTAHPGDVLHASATGGDYRAVWIYRNDTELVVACPTSTCSATLAAVGDYSVVALSASAPLAAPTGKLDADVAAASRAGATYQIEPVLVR